MTVAISDLTRQRLDAALDAMLHRLAVEHDCLGGATSSDLAYLVQATITEEQAWSTLRRQLEEDGRDQLTARWLSEDLTNIEQGVSHGS